MKNKNSGFKELEKKGSPLTDHFILQMHYLPYQCTFLSPSDVIVYQLLTVLMIYLDASAELQEGSQVLKKKNTFKFFKKALYSIMPSFFHPQ